MTQTTRNEVGELQAQVRVLEALVVGLLTYLPEEVATGALGAMLTRHVTDEEREAAALAPDSYFAEREAAARRIAADVSTKRQALAELANRPS